MCGRRKLERDFPDLVDWGNMEFGLVKEIAKQIPSGIVCQFHFNGESLLHPQFGECVSLFKHTIRCMDTNAKLLLEKADEIIDNLETLTISVVQDDPEGGEQLEIVKEFIGKKGSRSPAMVYRLLGRVDHPERWEALPGTIAKRILHSPDGSHGYERKVTVPEIGICLDLLTHMAIDRYGNISLCVRFDPKGDLRLGNIANTSLEEAWASEKRKRYLEYHIRGDRKALPGCSKCEFWGCPTSP